MPSGLFPSSPASPGGGSTSTYATSLIDRNMYQLYGHKWFSSATDAQMSFTLARIVDKDGLVTKGTEGLSLFCLETRTKDGHLNNIEIQRLKDKLGTRQLPTAELLLDGTKAYLVGKKGKGISNISPILNITRLHNSINAVGIMRRMMQLCADYSTKRMAFGKYLSMHPLHMKTLAKMELQTRGCTLLVMEVCRLLGLNECSMSCPEDDMMLRILIPLAKLYTAKEAIIVASEGIEAFGGQGYMEDTGLPCLLRDAQVLPIWEGTTNILSLDVIKVIEKFKDEVLKEISKRILSHLSKCESHLIVNSAAVNLRRQLERTIASMNLLLHDNNLKIAARDLSLSLAQIYIGSLLVSHASFEDSTDCDKYASLRWSHLPIALCDSNVYTMIQEEIDSTLVQNISEI